METLIEKISTYNILNYILPGVIFVWFINIFFSFDLLLYIKGDTVINLFIFYFLGMVISRIGSLITEPTLKLVKFVVYASYNDFIKAENLDEKIKILSCKNNIYRTLTTLFFVTGLFFIVSGCLGIKIQYFITKFSINMLLFLFFLFSYKKQAEYIVSRIESTLSNNQQNVGKNE